MTLLVYALVCLVPMAAWVFFLRWLHRSTAKSEIQWAVQAVIAGSFLYLFASMISMAGAFGIGPWARTPIIVVWLVLAIAFVAVIFWRWRHKLKRAAAPLFVIFAAAAAYGAFQHLRVADKPFWAANEVSLRSTCLDNLTEVSKALQLYADDNNDRLPISKWTDSISKYVSPSKFTCPKLDAKYAFTMNSEALGAPTYSMGNFVIAFDGFGGANRVGGIKDVRFSHIVDGNTSIALLGGAAITLQKHRMQEYIWDRKTAEGLPGGY